MCQHGFSSRSSAPRGFSCYYGSGSREDTRHLLLWARIGGPLGQPGWHHQALRRHDETGVCISSTTVSFQPSFEMFRRPACAAREITETFCWSIISILLSVVCCRRLLGSRRCQMHECLELALKRFRYAITPSFRDRLRTRVGKDLLFTLFKTIEDAGCRCFGRRLRNLQAAVHIRVDGADDDGMNRDALVGQQRSQRLRQLQRGRLRGGVRRYHRQGSEPRQGHVIEDGSFGTFQKRQERAGHSEQTEEIDREGLFK